MPRRHQLRGPFGQMLMEEMAKSDLKQQVGAVLSQDVLLPGCIQAPGDGESPESVSLGSSPVTVSKIIMYELNYTVSSI